MSDDVLSPRTNEVPEATEWPRLYGYDPVVFTGAQTGDHILINQQLANLTTDQRYKFEIFCKVGVYFTDPGISQLSYSLTAGGSEFGPDSCNVVIPVKPGGYTHRVYSYVGSFNATASPPTIQYVIALAPGTPSSIQVNIDAISMSLTPVNFIF